MKKILQVLCYALGGGILGYFANQLDTVVGCVHFALGVALLVAPLLIFNTKDHKDN